MGITTERDFEPHSLIFFEGNWYTKGFCHKRNELRTLAVARMTSVYSTGRIFAPDYKIINSSSEDLLFNTEYITDVVVRCDSFLHNIVKIRPLHPQQEIISLPNGECELHVSKISKYHLQSWIMHQCGRATIVAPQNVAAEICEFAEKILNNHASTKSRS